jgi:hypothetical protein
VSGLMRLVVVLALVGVAGCAYVAVKTPTPAALYRADEIEQGPPPPNESYYILVFGSQSIPKVPRKTHTWATAVRVTESPTGEPIEVEPHTISWMPATMYIRPWRFRVEKGVNLDLRESIKAMSDDDQRVSMWGPYQMRAGAYAKFRMQKAFLETGRVGYQCIDSTGEAGWTGRGCDCIHAVTDMDAVYDRDRYRLDRYGAAASRFIVKQLFERQTLIAPERTHDWLIPRLGIDKYEVERQTYDGPANPYQGTKPADDVP